MQAQAGELLAERPEVRVELLADSEALAVTSSRLASTAPAPPRHVHDGHADCFLVLGGALLLDLDGSEQRVEPQSWIQVPRGIVHTFRAAAGTQPASFVNVHTPSGGLAAYLRRLMAASSDEERRRALEGFDARLTPAGSGLDPATAVVRRLGGAEGETITERQGRRLTLLAETEELAVTETVYGRGERGPDLHVHDHHTDAWLVLDGTLTFVTRDEVTFSAGPGHLVVVPPGIAHGFANEGEATARFLNLHAPSCGFGDYLRGRNPGFDQHDPPPDGGADPAAILVRAFT
jgi:quercetin dioxygenase-like cupin family protein